MEIIAAPIVWIYDAGLHVIAQARIFINWCKTYPDRALTILGIFVLVGLIAAAWGNFVDRHLKKP